MAANEECSSSSLPSDTHHHSQYTLRVIEFYAGIGGYHYALKDSNPNAEIVASIDINTNANRVYSHNFPGTLHLNRNICGLSAEELDRYEPDVFFLSPPCQPFTRQGLRKDNLDRRTDSFFHLMTVLSEMKRPPRYILMENVQGFESSHTRHNFVGILRSLEYNVQEFLLSPSQFGVPNSRLRFYLLAKSKTLKFGVELDTDSQPCKDAELLMPFAGKYSMLDTCTMGSCDVGAIQVSKPVPDDTTAKRTIPIPNSSIPIPTGPIPIPVGPTPIPDTTLSTTTHTECTSSIPSSVPPHPSMPLPSLLSNFLEHLSDKETSHYLVPDKTLEKYAIAMDIVHPSSNHSCCFTKAYGSYALGTGSILQHSLDPCDLSEAFKEYTQYQSVEDKQAAVESLRRLKLRYFTPREVANLMCFPQTFSFPDGLSRKQCYKVLGNSLNVYVVTVLVRYLFQD